MQAPTPPRLLRRVHKSQIDANGQPTRGAFTPTPEDTDGISFFDPAVVTCDQVKAGARNPAGEYRVLSVRVADVNGLELRETPSDLPGHYSAAQFNYDAYEADKKSWRTVQRDLLRVSEFAD